MWLRRPARRDLALILGCQRSGTTLVGLMLEAHPDVELVEETDRDFHPAGDDGPAFDLDAVKAHRVRRGRLRAYKAPRETHRFDELVASLAQSRVIWVERDVLPVVASMLTLQLGEISWAARNADVEVRKHVARFGDHAAMLAAETERLGPDDGPLVMAALCWAVKDRHAQMAADQLGDQMLRVRYDDLVGDPEAAAEQLTSFLDLTPSAAMVDHPQHVAPGRRPGKTDATRTIDTSSLDKWRELSDHQISLAEAVVDAYRNGTDLPV